MSYKDLDPFNYIDIKPQNYKTKPEIFSDLEQISTNLENITNDWKERELSLQKIGSISKGNQNKSDIFIKYFNTKLCSSLEMQLSDLRSSVMKEACRITSLCARELGLLIEPGITQLLSQNCLFKIAGSANKVISDSSSKCILNIVRYVHCIKVITNICEIRTMKSNNVRILCAQCLVNIISYYDNIFIIKNKDIIEETIKCLLIDANAEVRFTTRKAFILYKSRFEKEGEKLFNELGKNVQKQIIEDEKNLDKTFKIKLKNENNDKLYLKSISKEIDDNLEQMNYKDVLQNKPKTPEFNILKKKNSNDFNKNQKNNSNKNNNINYIKQAKSNKKSVNKNEKKYIVNKKKEETVQYINLDYDDNVVNEVCYIDLNDNEEEIEKIEEDNNDNKNQINSEDTKEINAVFNYSNKTNKKTDNENNDKIEFNKSNQNKIIEDTNNFKLTDYKKINNTNPFEKGKNDNSIKRSKIYQSELVNNYLDINKTNINN